MSAMPLTAQGIKVAPRADKIIDVPELGGTLRLMQLSARVALKSRSLQAKQGSGEDVTEEQNMLIVMNGIVDGAGKPLFPSVEAATAFLDQIAPETYLKIISEIGSLNVKASTEGNPSTASPSGV